MKTMKKALSVLLSVVMVFSMTVTAFAAETAAGLEFVTSNSAPQVGDEFTVSLNVTSNTGFNAFDIHLTYDENVVEFLGFETTYDEDAGEDVLVSDFVAGSLVSYNNTDAKISLARTNNSTKTGTLFTAKFKAVAEGDAKIAYNTDTFNMTNGDGEAVVFTVGTDAISTLAVVAAPAETYTVTLTQGTGYTIAATGDAGEVEKGGSFEFSVTVADGYKFTDSFAVKANGTPLTGVQSDDKTYVFEVADITEDVTVTVEGIDAVLAAGYTVSVTPETQTKQPSETAEVTIKVESDDVTGFNALYAQLTYDPAYLALATTTVEGYEITDSDGTVTVVGYGEDKSLGNAVTVGFTVTAVPEGGTVVTLVQANVDASANADVQDAPEANYGNTTATINVGGHNVTYPESDFTGDNVVDDGEDYTLTAKDPNYVYTLVATVDGETVPVIDNGDGTYTVENVTGELVITIEEKTGKEVNVTVNGAQDGQVVYEATANYMTDYVFTVNAVEGFSTAVAVTVGGTDYTYSAQNYTYTIDGADITGDIVITVTNTVSEYTVSFEGTGAGDASSDNMAVNHGDDFTFTVTEEDGYVYEITAAMDGVDVDVADNGDGTYTIRNVTGDLAITVEKSEKEKPTVEVYEYVKVDNFVVYLVTATSESISESGALGYNGNVMYWSDEYNAYAYLVISDEVLTAEAAAENVSEIAQANAETVVYTGDVNNTNVVDVNDAQLVYDIYNAEYQTFDALSMSKFLRADVNASKAVDVNDAAAIVNTIMGN